MNALRIEIEDGVIIAEAPDSDGDMAIYATSGGTIHLNADARRELIAWLADCTKNPPCIGECR